MNAAAVMRPFVPGVQPSASTTSASLYGAVTWTARYSFDPALVAEVPRLEVPVRHAPRRHLLDRPLGGGLVVGGTGQPRTVDVGQVMQRPHDLRVARLFLTDLRVDVGGRAFLGRERQRRDRHHPRRSGERSKMHAILLFQFVAGPHPRDLPALRFARAAGYLQRAAFSSLGVAGLNPPDLPALRFARAAGYTRQPAFSSFRIAG